ncbi:hypothetical protein AFCA_007891 [Aspergillus flavus]|nr:hypothetical protein AFCA_007891 [Aspergillus flavus]
MADPLGIAASVIALIKLAGSATQRDRIEDAEDAMTALGTHKPLSIQSFVGPDNPLILFRRLLEDIIAQLSPQSKLQHRSLSLTWPFTKKDVAEKLACLERLKSHFTLVMQSDLL